MFGCECWCCEDILDFYASDLRPFSLPSPLPKWPQGQAFATGKICLGELEVLAITDFNRIWSCSQLRRKRRGTATFYGPVVIPYGYFCLGHYCQTNDGPLRGHVLVARDTASHELPALKQPLNYSLVWSTDSAGNGCGYVWQPIPPEGYKALGFLVTDDPDEPGTEEIRCVREDLTEPCETYREIFGMESKSSKNWFRVWKTEPCRRGMRGRGVPVGTFFCSTYLNTEKVLDIACLKNSDHTLHAMPSLTQIEALIQHYGPTVFFHPDETYLPSSVQWFFKNGAVLYKQGNDTGEPVNYIGSNLPRGGENDGQYWIDLPNDNERRDVLKKGEIVSAELYVHVKPAEGGTFTDIVMWVFCPFNGPATIKVGLLTIPMSKIGQHVGDWEHFTLRISNFTGELRQVFFSEHSGGSWVDASELEFIEGNKPIVYSSKNGHASFPHPGTYLQGLSKLGIGLRNDVAQSNYCIDSSIKYQIIAAEYLGEEAVEEPCWLQYMREWGPTIVYDSRSELEKLIDRLPVFVRFSVENLFDLFPTELYGEEGPTGPKVKDNWVGDEIC